MDLLRNIIKAAERGRNLLLDREIRIGITGLSRGGKTAFITSLVNTISHFGESGFNLKIPRFRSYDEFEICYGGIAPARDLSVAAFPYRRAMEALLSDPPRWPEPTDGISEIRLEIRYRDDRWLRKGEQRRLFIDIWDYPGEWLLDLTLLNLSYEEFSLKIREQIDKVRGVADPSAWIRDGELLEPQNTVDDTVLNRVVTGYTEWLKACKSCGLAFILPGRFVLPGHLEGAPILQFVPWVWKDLGECSDESLYCVMASRYEAYREQVVRKFYRECFSRIDRQIVIVDCLQALMGGRETFMDINDTFQILLQNFNYGNSTWWNRLFSPRIDRVVFAASKCDRATYDEHQHLLSLLKSMVSQAVGVARADGAHCEYLVLSAISTTRCMTVRMKNGEDQQFLTTDDPDEKPFFPGSVPDVWTRENMDFFRQHFRLSNLRPLSPGPEGVISQLNLDVLLQYLIGDKL
jgi:predicted YcjX-like family ATPase